MMSRFLPKDNFERIALPMMWGACIGWDLARLDEGQIALALGLFICDVLITVPLCTVLTRLISRALP
jgi:hypothetical protein